MTTTTTPLLRNVAICIPLTVGGAAWFDAAIALGAVASSLLVLANLTILSVLVPGILRAIASQRSPALLMGLVLVKFVLFTVLLLWLTRTFPPMGVVLGFVPMVLGTLITGIELALRGPGDPVQADLEPHFNEASS